MDESFRDVLPWFRPHSQDVSWLMWAFLAFLVLVVVSSAIAFYVARWRHRKALWQAFEETAKERELSGSQRRLLTTIARRDRMKNPMLLLGSLAAFDRHVGGYAAALVGEGSAVRQRVLDDISSMRRSLGFDRLRSGQLPNTTRELPPGQMLLMIWPEKGGPEGFVQCVVVSRDDRAIAAVPLLKEGERFLGELQAEERIKARFWQDGVEYRFRTSILESIPETTTILIRHAEKLERVQESDFFRLPMDGEIELFVLSRETYESLTLEDAVRRKRGERIAARLFYVSGEGIGISTGESIPEDHLLMVDPGFEGGVPLGGMTCKVERAEEKDGEWRLYLCFVNFTPEEQQAIIASVQRRQLRTAHGYS